MLVETLIISAVSLLSCLQTAGTESSSRHSRSSDISDYPDYGDGFLPYRSKFDPYAGNGQDQDSSGKSSERRSEDNRDGFRPVDNWPDASKRLGQLSAVSLDVDGNVVVFHRGDRVWGAQTFRDDNTYADRSAGPIAENTIVVFDVTTGKVLRETGTNMFFMPHGLTVDSANNVWVTDVGLHQVFKLPPVGANAAPLLALGTSFVPGNDGSHFCKPTDVAISPDGSFFVSDGYCNSRIIKYSPSGSVLMQWGRSTLSTRLHGAANPGPYDLLVPHALALAADRDMLCVADRENGRVQCFSARNGTFVASVKGEELGSRIFGVAYSPAEGGQLLTVSAADFGANNGAHGSVLALSSRAKAVAFGADLRNPHDVAVSNDGRRAFVVELNPYRVWQYRRGSDNASAPPPIISTPLPSPTKAVPTPSPVSSPSESRGTFAVAALGGAVVAFAVAVVVAAARCRRRGFLSGYNSRTKRWEFPRSPVDGFKLGHFLDRHQGFEKVNTEESDEDAANSGSDSTPSAAAAQFMA